MDLSGVVSILATVQLGQPYMLFFVVVSCILGIYFCGKTAKDCGVHDHGSIVFDEFAGLLLLVILPTDWLSLLFIFVVFRFFDIVKPFPIKWLDQKVGVVWVL